MVEAGLGDIQVHKQPDQLGCREEDRGILLQSLYLLVADEGELGNLSGPATTRLSQRGSGHPLTKES